MKSEKIITALTDIDGQFIREAREETATPHRSSRRIAVLIAAVIALMAITATAFASEYIAGWFKQYFEKQANAPLSPEQIQFVEENEQVIAETQLQNNCTVELKSFMTDGQIALMTIHVTAPEGMNITEAQIGNWAGHLDHAIFQPIGET